MVARWKHIIPIGVGLIFVAAGLLKAKDPSSLNRMLLFDGFPTLWLSPLALFIIQFEIILGLALICRVAPRKMAVVALCALVVFCGQLGYLLTFEDPPSCGCLGDFSSYKSGRASAQYGLARNIALMGFLSYYLYSIRPRPGTLASAPNQKECPSPDLTAT